MTDQRSDGGRSLRNRIQYRFDNLLSRGTWAPLLVLGAVTFMVVLFSSILLLGYRRRMSAQEADSRTLPNLLLLRRELEARGGEMPRIVVEVLDADNADLARTTGADDYLVSDAISSRLITQLAEQPERRAVILSLYGAEGPSIHLVNAANLGLTGDVGACDIIATAYSAGLLAIGWRDVGGEVVLNPDLSSRATLTKDDQIVVIG
jgi:hypothetical protein